MRYRALGASGRSVSAVALTLPRSLAGREGVELIFAALEAGVNTFELRDPTAAAAHSLGEALATVERHIVVVLLRIGEGDPRAARVTVDLSRDAILQSVEGALHAAGLDHFDAVLLDNPQLQHTTAETMSALLAVKTGGRATLVGMSGDVGDTATRAIDALGVVYNLRSTAIDHLRIKTAAKSGLILFGERFRPTPSGASADAPETAPERNWLGLRRRVRQPIEVATGYEFLTRTPGWTADEICLAYALNEPALSTVFIEAATPEDVARLAAVPDRIMPSQLPAQIEMAKFAAGV